MPDITARQNLINYALVASPNEVAFAKCEQLADAYRAEVLRELRRSVLAASLEGPVEPGAGGAWTRGYRAGLSVAADLATPAAAPSDPGREG